MPVTFLNTEGDPVSAMDLVTQITASASLKKTDGAYGSADAFQSMTATIPPGLSADTLRGLANDLYAECAQAVEARIADLLTIKTVSKTELDEFFGSREERAAEREAQKQAPPAPGKPADAPQTEGGRVLKFAPRAGERQPGDTWTATVTHYKLTADKLELWKDGSKYPEASLYPNSPAWPAETWTDRMVKDGSKQPFAKSVIVVQTVSDKKNDKGFFYVNVQKLEVAKEAVA